jgi:Domain of unknown function (DUF6487)
MSAPLPELPDCPNCHAPMTAGYLAVANRANWVDRVGSFDAAFWKGDTVVGNFDMLARTAGHLRGWRCTRCQLMLLDYGAGIF